MINFFANLIYRKYQPKIILVSGSDGKSLTVAIIESGLKRTKSVFNANYHADHRLAAPLTFLLLPEKNQTGLKKISWFKIVSRFLKLYFSRVAYPEYLIIEFGFERPDLVDYWISRIKIDYLIITATTKFPPFADVFAGPDKILARKKILVKKADELGAVCLNADDLNLVELGPAARAKVVFFSLRQFDLPAEASDWIRAAAIEIYCNLETEPEACGTRFELMTPLGQRQVFLKNIFGKGAIYASLAGAGLFLEIGFSLTEVVDVLENFQGLAHRFSLIKSSRGAWILDNSFHLTDQSLEEDLDIFQRLPGRRKILILGDMLNLGRYALEVHQDFGQKIAPKVDYLVAFGVKTKFTVEKAIESGLAEEKTKHFYEDQLKDLIDFAKELIRGGDLVLIAGDKNLKLWLLVEALA